MNINFRVFGERKKHLNNSQKAWKINQNPLYSLVLYWYWDCIGNVYLGFCIVMDERNSVCQDKHGSFVYLETFPS